MKKVAAGVLLFFFAIAAFQPGGWQEQYLTTATFSTNGIFNRTNHVGLQPRSSIYDFDLGVGIYLTNTRHPLLTVDNIRLDANTITTTNGALTLQSDSGNIILNGSAVSNFGLWYNDLESFFNADMHLLGGATFDLNNGTLSEVSTLNVESLTAFNNPVITVNSPIDFNGGVNFTQPVTNSSETWLNGFTFLGSQVFVVGGGDFNLGDSDIIASNRIMLSGSGASIQSVEAGGVAFGSPVNFGNNRASNVNGVYATNEFLYINGNRILSNRQPAIADVTNAVAGMIYSQAEIDLINSLRTTVTNLQATLRRHGLIEP